MQIDIIGAGIGGLTTALFLQRQGVVTRVFEQAEVIKPVGAGIILANNAMQVYDKLGLRQELEAQGNPLSALHITDAQLRPISSTDLRFFSEKFGVRNVAIHRGLLQQVLVDHLVPGSLQLGRKLAEVTKSGSRYTLRFTTGETVESQVLIGADGIDSTVRKELFPPSTTRAARQLCWRGVTEFELPARYQREVCEAWGRGTRFGFVPIGAKQVYWFALQTIKPGRPMLAVEELASGFAAYHPLVRALLEATPAAAIHTAPIADLRPLATWHQGQVCLLGDAAHATTPNLGQGAGQAIEDAYVLSRCLDQYEPLEAFATFEHLRRSKVDFVVRTSWALGQVAHWKNAVAVRLRNLLMSLVPDSLNRRQLDKLFRLEEA